MPTVARIISRRHARAARKRARQKRSGLWLALIIGIPSALALGTLFVALGLAMWLYASAASVFPTAHPSMAFDGREPTRFYDRSESSVIYAMSGSLGEAGRWIPLQDMPQAVIDATLMMEDGDDSLRGGFDALGSLLRVWAYMLGESLPRDDGIAGRLAREELLPRVRTSGLDADLLELALTAESKRRYRAETLLEWRLNSKYYGHGAIGIEAAARVYFDKSAEALSLAEAALLTAVADSPRVDAFDEAALVRQRQMDLLRKMLDAGLISQDDFDVAASGLNLRRPGDREQGIAASFGVYAQRQAQTLLDGLGYDGARLLARGGLRITTTLDMDLYVQSECFARAHLGRLGGKLDGGTCEAARELSLSAEADDGGPNEITIALLDVGSGEVLIMLGDALRQDRQPGLILQPFVYMEGFLRRLVTPASMVYDVPHVYPGAVDGLIYSPANPDGRFRGPLNLRDAMAAGLVPPAVQVANNRGIEQVIRTAQRLGFNSLEGRRYQLDILERGGGTSVLDAGYAYSTLASLGVMRGIDVEPIGDGFRGRDPVAILRIRDADGAILWEYDDRTRQSNETVIVEPSLAYLVNDVLSDANTRGRVLDEPIDALGGGHSAAVVDGMSADRRDSWTVGYTPHVVLAVHAGRADRDAMKLAHDERAASTPVWRALMNYLVDSGRLSREGWPRPPDIEEFVVCELSGMLPPATDHCPTRREIVPAGSSLRRDTRWQTVEINIATGQGATVTTAESLRRREVYFVPPDAIMEWWVAEGRPLPPSAYEEAEVDADVPAAQIRRPADFAYVGGEVAIEGRVNAPGSVYQRLEYGQGVNPQEWFAITSERGVETPQSISAVWDTSGLEGVYTIRLSALFEDGRGESDSAQVTLDNTRPTVFLRTSGERPTVAYPTDNALSLLAEASDNLTIERVEFYVGAELLGVDREWPYGIAYAIAGEGTLRFQARAFDTVGNSAASELIVDVVAG